VQNPDSTNKGIIMKYEELFAEIQKPENRVLKKVIRMMGDLENVKYSLRGEKKILLYALGSDAGKYAPDWVIKSVFVDGNKQDFSTEQIVAVFDALQHRYKEDEKKQAIIAKQIQRAM
jgi:hypothetical protein